MRKSRIFHVKKKSFVFDQSLFEKLAFSVSVFCCNKNYYFFYLLAEYVALLYRFSFVVALFSVGGMCFHSHIQAYWNNRTNYKASRTNFTLFLLVSVMLRG